MRLAMFWWVQDGSDTLRHCDWWCLMMSPCKECDYSCWCLNHWTQVSQGTPRKRGQSGQGSCGFNSWPSTSKTNESRICCQEVLQWYGPVQDISTEDEKAHLFLAVLTLTVDHDVMQQPLIVIKKKPLLHSCWASSSTRRMRKTCTSLTSFPRRAARSWDWRTRNSSNLSYFFHFSLNLRQFPIVTVCFSFSQRQVSEIDLRDLVSRRCDPSTPCQTPRTKSGPMPMMWDASVPEMKWREVDHPLGMLHQHDDDDDEWVKWQTVM